MILPSTTLPCLLIIAEAYVKTYAASASTKMVHTYHFQNTPFADLAVVGPRRLEHATFIAIP
jgi:transcriptional regulator of heat shock response